MKRVFIPGGCMALLLFAQQSCAQQRTPDTSKAYWNPATEKTVFYQAGITNGFPKAQQQKMYASMARVMEWLHHLPVLNPPKGFTMGVSATICGRGCAHAGIMSAESAIITLAYWQKGNEVERDVEGPAMRFYFNDIYRLFGHGMAENGTFYNEPAVIDSFQGHPVYAGGLVVVTKNKKPLFIPVTNEMQIKENIRWRKEAIAGFEKERSKASPYQQWLKDKDANTQAFLDGLKYLAQSDPAKAKAEKEKYLINIKVQDSIMKAAEAQSNPALLQSINKFNNEVAAEQEKLNRMTAAERKAPAPRVGGYRQVVPNPDFFNRSVPAYELQLVIIDFNLDGAMPQTPQRKLFTEVKRTINLKGILEMLKG